MYVISSIIKSVKGDKRRTMLDSGGLSLGEEGNEGNKGGNGELHVDSGSLDMRLERTFCLNREPQVQPEFIPSSRDKNTTASLRSYLMVFGALGVD